MARKKGKKRKKGETSRKIRKHAAESKMAVGKKGGVYEFYMLEVVGELRDMLAQLQQSMPTGRYEETIRASDGKNHVEERVLRGLEDLVAFLGPDGREDLGGKGLDEKGLGGDLPLRSLRKRKNKSLLVAIRRIVSLKRIDPIPLIELIVNESSLRAMIMKYSYSHSYARAHLRSSLSVLAGDMGLCNSSEVKRVLDEIRPHRIIRSRTYVRLLRLCRIPSSDKKKIEEQSSKEQKTRRHELEHRVNLNTA